MQINYYGSQLGCGCRGSCGCSLPPIPKPVQRQPRPRIDLETLVNMLVQTMSCGNSELSDYLTKAAPIIIKRNGFCYDELLFISAQIELLDHALFFLHDYAVDYSDSRSQSKSLQIGRSKSTTEAKAQATSQSHSCGFSDASSFNQFVRDSYDRSRSESTTDSESNGYSDSHTWDRSNQQAHELSQVWDTARSTSDGLGEGSHFERTNGSGASYSRTAPQPDTYFNDINAGNASLANISGFFSNLWSEFANGSIRGEYEWSPLGGTYGFNFDDSKSQIPGFASEDLRDVFGDTIDNLYNDPGGQVPIPGITTPDEYCCCDDILIGFNVTDCERLGQPPGCHWKNEIIYPTVGEMYTVNWQITVGFEFLKRSLSFRLSWGRGGNYNRSHVITKACTGTTGTSETENFYNQTDWSRAHGETLTNQDSYTNRDYHVRAESERTAHSRTDAGSANTGDAEGESESGAERTSHSEARGSSQGTNWSKSQSRGNSLTTSDSESESIAESLSHIFTALSKMRSVLFDQRKRFRAIFNARQGAAIGRLEECRYAIPADPVNQARLRALHTRWSEAMNPETIPESQEDTTGICA